MADAPDTMIGVRVKELHTINTKIPGTKECPLSISSLPDANQSYFHM
jgi:hypothetical protein